MHYTCEAIAADVFPQSSKTHHFDSELTLFSDIMVMSGIVPLQPGLLNVGVFPTLAYSGRHVYDAAPSCVCPDLVPFNGAAVAVISYYERFGAVHEIVFNVFQLLMLLKYSINILII